MPRPLTLETLLYTRLGELRVGRTSGCWYWTAAVDKDGYGRVKYGKVMMRAHRLSYIIATKKDLSQSEKLDHTCHSRAKAICPGGSECPHRRCVNPAHLEPVSTKVNINRGHTGRNNASKTHCPAGHPYAGDNLTFKPNGGRRCRACHKAARDKYERSGKRPARGARNGTR